MAIVVPFISLIASFIALGNAFRNWGWRVTFLRVITLFFTYALLTTELLSLLHGINEFALVFVWVLPAIPAIGYLVTLIKSGKGIVFPHLVMPTSILERLLIVCILLIILLTGVVAWIAPPNTWDSLNTHMSRVAHWAQEGSIRPFATGIEKQNYYPPLPGIAILQTYVLSQGDRWANSIQWVAMIGSVIGASLIARVLGADRIGQLFASVFVVTLPMGIAHASSTMTDYIVALWMIVVASESLTILKGTHDKSTIIFLCLAAALAINTKPTAYAYLLPFAIVTGIALLLKSGLRTLGASLILCIVIVIALNAGFLTRNVILYNNPIGPSRGISFHSNEILDWRVLVSNMLRNASLHAGSPISKLNSYTYSGLLKIHELMGLELADPRTTMGPDFRIKESSTDEKSAANHYHAILILLSVFLLLLRRKDYDKIQFIYVSIVISTFILFSIIYKFTIFGSRYDLPFFVLFAPLVGMILSESFPASVSKFIMFILILASWSWVVGIDNRPLLPKADDQISVFTTPRDDLYFAQEPHYQAAYQRMTRAVLDQSCSNVGLAIGGAEAEYPFWVYLGAPDEDLHIEWIVGGTPSAAYTDPDFEPCAVICDSTCPIEWETIRGLPIYEDRAGYRLYMRGNALEAE